MPGAQFSLGQCDYPAANISIANSEQVKKKVNASDKDQ